MKNICGDLTLLRKDQSLQRKTTAIWKEDEQTRRAYEKGQRNEIILKLT